MVCEELARGRVPLPTAPAPAVPATVPDPATVLDFLQAARDGMPLGSMTWHQPDSSTFEIVDGIARVNAIARVLTPELYTDASMRWPVIALPPDHPRAGRFAWGEQPGWGPDPAAFPLSAALKTMSFLGWEAALRNRTSDESRVTAALNAAYAISKSLLEAQIVVYVVRPGVDEKVDDEQLLEIRHRANSRFCNTR